MQGSLLSQGRECRSQTFLGGHSHGFLRPLSYWFLDDSQVLNISFSLSMRMRDSALVYLTKVGGNLIIVYKHLEDGNMNDTN